MRTFTQKWAFMLMTLLCCIAMPQVVTAQTCVEIGDGTSLNNNLPICGYYHGSYTQQLYLADEIDHGAANIESVSFQYGLTTSTKRTISIFMANTDAENLSSGYITNDEFVEVLSATEVEFDNSDDWFAIELETPFAYDGSSNLLVVVFMDYAATETNYNSNSRFKYTTASNMARYTTYDNTTAGGLTVVDGVLTANTYSSGITGTVSSNRPNIQLCFGAGGGGPVCNKPSALVPSDTTAHGITLTWAEGSGVYNLEYKKAADTVWTRELSNTTLLTTTLSNLVPSTDYQARVQSVCADTVSGWKTAAFKTAIGLPYGEAFSSSTTPGDWKIYSGKLADVMAGGNLTATTGTWTFGTNNGVFDSHAKIEIYSTRNHWLVTTTIPLDGNAMLCLRWH